MKYFKLLLSIIILFSIVAPAYGIVVKKGNTIELTREQVIDDDLIALGRTVIIHGKVNGDLYAFAQKIEVSGDVKGTIFCGASQVKISSPMVNSVWAGAGDITISATAEKNVMLFGGNLLITRDAWIKKDLRCYGGEVNILGEITGTIKGSSGRFLMSGRSGTINIKSDEVKIEKDARVNGDLIVRGDKRPVIESGAAVSGQQKVIKETKKTKGEFLKKLAPALGFFISLFKTITFIAMIIVGIVLITFSKRFPRRIMDICISRPWVSLGWGFLGIIVIPVVIIILLVTLIGYPFALFGIYFYTVLLYLASIFVALVLGEKIIQLFKKEGDISLYLSFIVGVIVLTLLYLIPVLGFIIKIIVTILGSGVLLLGGYSLCKDMRSKELI